MFTIRPVEERDQTSLLSIARDVGAFSAEDVDTVAELVDIYLHEPQGKEEYDWGAACDEHDQVLGFACYGPTPLTERTFDFYWLAVSKAAQGQGVGRALMEWVEQQARARGGRLLVLETSGTDEYAAARRLYERLGWKGRLCVPDFYHPGDDLFMFHKHLS
jgi:GNAT superfamily N-acetyltransferase